MPKINYNCKKCPKENETLRAWKTHMSRKHGGYSKSELAEISGIPSTTNPEDLRTKMETVVETLPLSEPKLEEQPLPTVEVLPPIPEPEPERKRIKATPRYMKKLLGTIPREILKTSGIELDSDDVDAMDEAGEFISEVFGIEFSVPEKNFVVTSRPAAIVWLFAITGLIWLKHNVPDIFKNLIEENKNEDQKQTDKAK